MRQIGISATTATQELQRHHQNDPYFQPPRARHHAATARRRQIVYHYHCQGWTLACIAKKLKISMGTVWHDLRKYYRNNPQLPKVRHDHGQLQARRQRIYRLHARGKTQAEIAQLFQLHVCTINRDLKRYYAEHPDVTIPQQRQQKRSPVHIRTLIRRRQRV